MGVQSNIMQVSESLTYPSTKPIATKQHMAVWVFDPDAPAVEPFFGWAQVSVLDFDLINNAAVIRDETVLVNKTLIEVRVADDPDELLFSPTVIGIVAGAISEIEIVAGNIYEVKVAADNIDAIKTCSDNMVDINVCAQNIQEIIDAPVFSEQAKQEAWNAEAEAMTADSYATEAEDVEVKEYISNGDGTFTATPIPGTYSSYHYMLKALSASGGLVYLGGWDASTGNYPTTRPPEGTGDPLVLADTFIITHAGTIDGRDMMVGDYIVYNGAGANPLWSWIPKTVSWSQITGIPANVLNAITDVELQAGLDTKPTGDWTFDGVTLAITIP